MYKVELADCADGHDARELDIKCLELRPTHGLEHALDTIEWTSNNANLAIAHIGGNGVGRDKLRGIAILIDTDEIIHFLAGYHYRRGRADSKTIAKLEIAIGIHHRLDLRNSAVYEKKVANIWTLDDYRTPIDKFAFFNCRGIGFESL